MTNISAHPELIKSLIKARSEFPKILTDSSNPHFKNKYASLPYLIDEITPVLLKNGLILIQVPEFKEGTLILKSQILHISGGVLEGTYNIEPVKKDPQGIGSAITYARRYSLCAMLGIAADVDDDANSASLPHQNYYKPIPKEVHATRSPPSSFDEPPMPGFDTDPQYTFTFGKFKGQTLSQVPEKELLSYEKYLQGGISKDIADGKEPHRGASEAIKAINQFLGNEIMF